MRILHVPHAYAPVHGGAEVMMDGLTQALHRQGEDVRVVTTDVSEVAGLYEPGVPKLRRGLDRISGVDVVRLPYGTWEYSVANPARRVPWERGRIVLTGRLMNRSARRFSDGLAREVRRWKPDVVVTTPQDLPPVLSVLDVHRACRFPLVYIPLIHDDWSGDKVLRLKGMLHQPEAVVALTQYEATLLRTIYGVPEAKIFVVGMGLDTLVPADDMPRAARVVYLGRKVPEKGLADLVAAMSVVWETRPDAELVLAGAAGRWSAEISAMLAQVPEQSRRQIRSLDNIDDQTKSDLLSSATCLVLPSRSESFGIVLLEAMAHRTPVVTLDLPVYREVVAPGVQGFLATPGDPGDMAGGILRLLDDEALVREMGENGRRTVEREHGWDRVAQRYREAYKYAQGLVRSGIRV